MKLRTDFVSNSSSSSFCVAITVNGKDGSSHTLMIDPADEYVGGGGEAMLKKTLTPDSSFEQLADCIEEYCEPGSYHGEESELYDLEKKTVQTTVTITV